MVGLLNLNPQQQPTELQR